MLREWIYYFNLHKPLRSFYILPKFQNWKNKHKITTRVTNMSHVWPKKISRCKRGWKPDKNTWNSFIVTLFSVFITKQKLTFHLKKRFAEYIYIYFRQIELNTNIYTKVKKKRNILWKGLWILVFPENESHRRKWCKKKKKKNYFISLI